MSAANQVHLTEPILCRWQALGRWPALLAVAASSLAFGTCGSALAAEPAYQVLPVPLAGDALVVAQRAYLEYDRGWYARSVADAREAIRQRPDVVRLRILLANALRANGQKTEARRALNDAIAALGPQPDLTARLAQFDKLDAATRHAGAEQTQAAAPWFKLATRAYEEYARKDFASAARSAAEAIALRPDLLRLHLLRIDALSEAGGDEAAYQADLEAVQRVGDTELLRARRDALGNRIAVGMSARALRAHDSGDLATAAVLAAQAVAYAAPQRLDYRLQLMQVLLERNELADLEKQASAMLAQDERAVMAWVLRGYARSARSVHSGPGTVDVLADTQGGESDFAHALALDSSVTAESAYDSPFIRRLARIIIADTWLARGQGARVVDLLEGLRPVGDETDAMLADRLHRARVQIARAAGTMQGIDGRRLTTAQSDARPQILCRPDALGAACQVFPYDPGISMQHEMYAAQARGDWPGAARAAQAAVSAAPSVGQHRVDLINALSQAGDEQGATRAARAALDEGLLDGIADLPAAYAAQRAGDDRLSLAHFKQADANGSLPPAAAADAGYAAMRAHQNTLAAIYLERAIDTDLAEAAPASAATQTRLQDERSAHAVVTRNWGGSASLNYRGGQAGPGLASAPAQGSGSGNNFQANAEVYWRPLGSLGDRMFEVYLRDNESFGVENGPSGNRTNQAALGVRAKPFGAANAVFAFERIIPVGSAERVNWLVRAAYSAGFGTERRLDVASWWSVDSYAEIGHYLLEPSSYASAFVKAGRRYRVDALTSRLVVFPFAVAGLDYDSSVNHSVPVGVGAGISGRYFFRDSRYDTPRSFVDISLQYRLRVAGDERARGVFFGALFSY